MKRILGGMNSRLQHQDLFSASHQEIWISDLVGLITVLADKSLVHKHFSPNLIFMFSACLCY